MNQPECRAKRGNPLVWAKAKRELKEARCRHPFPFLGEFHDIGEDWPEHMRPSEIADFQYPDSIEDCRALCDAIQSAIKAGVIIPYATKVFRICEGGHEALHHFISAADFWRWFKPFDEPSEFIREWVNAWVEDPETKAGDGSDAQVGVAYRKRMAELGILRQAEAKANEEWWGPYVKEAWELVNQGRSKANAAQIVSSKHPEAKINPGTLRQKLK